MLMYLKHICHSHFWIFLPLMQERNIFFWVCGFQEPQLYFVMYLTIQGLLDGYHRCISSIVSLILIAICMHQNVGLFWWEALLCMMLCFFTLIMLGPVFAAGDIEVMSVLSLVLGIEEIALWLGVASILGVALASLFRQATMPWISLLWLSAYIKDVYGIYMGFGGASWFG